MTHTRNETKTSISSDGNVLQLILKLMLLTIRPGIDEMIFYPCSTKGDGCSRKDELLRAKMSSRNRCCTLHAKSVSDIAR